MTRPAHQTAFRPERRMMPGELGRQADELSIRTDSNPTSSHLEEFEHVASPLQINHIFNLVCFCRTQVRSLSCRVTHSHYSWVNLQLATSSLAQYGGAIFSAVCGPK